MYFSTKNYKSKEKKINCYRCNKIYKKKSILFPKCFTHYGSLKNNKWTCCNQYFNNKGCCLLPHVSNLMELNNYVNLPFIISLEKPKKKFEFKEFSINNLDLNKILLINDTYKINLNQIIKKENDNQVENLYDFENILIENNIYILYIIPLLMKKNSLLIDVKLIG